MAIDLVPRRFERLEKMQRETDHRVERIEETLARAADTLAAVAEKLGVHTLHFERMELAILTVSDRADRLATAIIRGRTQDLARFEAHERRIAALERQRKRRRP